MAALRSHEDSTWARTILFFSSVSLAAARRLGGGIFRTCDLHGLGPDLLGLLDFDELAVMDGEQQGTITKAPERFDELPQQFALIIAQSVFERRGPATRHTRIPQILSPLYSRTGISTPQM
jgi:hypothetical protein